MARLQSRPRSLHEAPAASRSAGAAYAGSVEPAAPRFATGWAALAYAVATLLLGYPALGGQFLVNPMSDQYLAGYAFREFAASQLHATGSFPLWNPYIFGGMPFVASMNGDLFYPPSLLLRAILPVDVAMTWLFLLHLFLAGLFAYVFLRACRFGFSGALAGGMAYMMSGFIASLASAGHDGKLYVAALLPLMLTLLVYGVRDGRAWAWGTLALATGFAVLSPHPQVFQYTLIACGAFGLYLAISEARAGRIERNVAIRRIAFALGAVILGSLMGAVQYLPVLHYTPWSPRAQGIGGFAAAASYSFPPEELINTYLPQFSGLLTAYWGRNGIHFHSEYVGVVMLMLAGAGLGAVKTRGFARFWLGVLLVSLLWALGGFTPFYHLIYAIVPGTKFFRAPSTMFFITAFSVALFVAIGVERILAGEIGVRYAAGWVIGGVVVAILAASGALVNVGVAIGSPRGVEAIDANARAVTLGGLRSLLFVALGAAVLIAFLRGKLAPRMAVWVFLVIGVVDLWTIERHYWRFSPPAHVIYAPNAATAYVAAQDKKEPGRVMTVTVYGVPSLAPNDPFIHGDALMIHRIRQIGTYHGNELGRYEEMLGDYPSSDLSGEQRLLSTPNFWRLENLKYVLTNLADFPVPGFTKLVGPVTDAEGTPLYLYGVPGDNPPAWVTPVLVTAADDAVAATLFNPKFDLATAALFDTSAKVAGATIKALPAPLSLRASTTRYDPGHITVQLDQPAPAGSALLVSENYYPGWTATVDGKPAVTGRADYTLIGVPLPAGARTVDLVFRSQPFVHGKWITIAASLLALLLIAGGLVARRHASA